MKFKVKYGYFTKKFVKEHGLDQIMNSSRINRTKDEVKPYIFYDIKKGYENIDCFVFTEPYKGKYRVEFFSVIGLKGEALKEFLKYLEENHLRNVVDLMI